MMCIQSYPASCYCAHNIAVKCWEKCGGLSPGPNTCPPLDSTNFDGPVKRAAENQVQAAPTKSVIPFPPAKGPLTPGKVPPTKICECESTVCIQSWPASCICANAGKHACWKKCGGVKPMFQVSQPPIQVLLYSKANLLVPNYTPYPQNQHQPIQLTPPVLQQPHKALPEAHHRPHQSPDLRRRPRKRKRLPHRLLLHQRPLQVRVRPRVRRHGYLRQGEDVRRLCGVQVRCPGPGVRG